jgi:hypothetical protein
VKEIRSLTVGVRLSAVGFAKTDLSTVGFAKADKKKTSPEVSEAKRQYH